MPGAAAVLPSISKGSSISRSCPSSCLWCGLVRPSSVASHCLTTSQPLSLAAWQASRPDCTWIRWPSVRMMRMEFENPAELCLLKMVAIWPYPMPVEMPRLIVALILRLSSATFSPNLV